VGTAELPLLGAFVRFAIEETVSERRPFLVNLVAPAGTGKTRLLEEFLDRLPRLAPAARTAIAQCLPYGQRLTYWPLRAVLFRLIDAPEDAAPEIVQMAAVRWLERAGVDSPRRIAEYLTATVGLGEAKVANRDALFTAWRTVVEVASRDAPFVLVFEDLHWSSDSLLDLVEFVMQPRGDLPVVIFALTRPELLERRPAWGGGRRNYLSIALPPLDDDSIRELVTPLLGPTSAEIVSRIVARAEGNPFYAGEIVRAIVERLPSPESNAAVEKVLATLPDTVHATVLARLDLLSAPERRALQLGSVFGRAFILAGLTALDPQMNRQDELRIDQNIGILRDIIESREHELNRRVEAYLSGDFNRVERELVNDLSFVESRPQWSERALAMCCDHRHYVDIDAARRILEFAQKYRLRLLEAQAWRALALAQHDASMLTSALKLFESSNANPYIARARCARALLTKDAQELAEGMRALDALADIDQLARIDAFPQTS